MRKILYYIPTFPTLSQNFILREIESLAGLPEFDLYILALTKDSSIRLPDKLVRKVIYFRRDRISRILDGLKFLFSKPGVFFKYVFKYFERPLTFGTALSMHSVVEQIKPDLIVANWITEGGLMANILSDLTSIPFGIECHAEDIWLSSPSYLESRIKDSKFVLTCTNYNASYLKKISPSVYWDKIHTIYHYPDVNLFGGNSTVFNELAQLYLVGRMVEKKGFIYFVRAAKILRDRGVKFKAKIVGSGAEKEHLVAEVKRLNLEEEITFLPQTTFSQHCHNYLKSDIFIAPSVKTAQGDIDGIPNVVVEAMLAGLPVVSTKISAIPEVVLDGVTGFLVNEKDENMLADRIEQLVHDLNLRKKMGEEGRKRILELFGYKNTIEKIKEVLLS